MLVPSRKLPPNDIIVSLYRSGFSCQEIAEKYAVSPFTVTGLLRRIGEPRRSTQEATAIRVAKGRTKTSRYWLGKKQPREMVERRTNKIRGENHYLWKGGNDTRPYRKMVHKELCALCATTEKLLIHHKDLNHYNNTPDNLQVLCLSCHSSIHKQAYWDAIHAGKDPQCSNAPNHWRPKSSGVTPSGDTP